MYIIKKKKKLFQIIINLKKNNKKIGLIPTMGNLHNGHMSLILAAKKYVDVIIVSIFINPIQFENKTDFEKYPKTFVEDCKKLKYHNIDILFCPEIHEMYQNTIMSNVLIDIPHLTNIVEGCVRNGHFQGVATIICKLFNIIQPHFAFFGKKDYQQLLIIKYLVKELNYMIKIIGIPTIRLNSGLAISSRNSYLNKIEMKIAPSLYRVIKKTTQKVLTDDPNNISNIIRLSQKELTKKGFSIDIFNIYDAITLHEISKKSKKVIILASVWLGKTRLIDNKIFMLK